MKKSIPLLFLFSLGLSILAHTLPNRPYQQEGKAVSTKTIKKAEKKQAKLEKKIKKLEKKLAKRGIHTSEATKNVWQDENFKLGAMVALGGLLLTILGVLPILGGIFTFIGGLMMVVGLALMIWVLIESY